MMKQFEKPFKSPTLCKLAQDHADRLVNQYGLVLVLLEQTLGKAPRTFGSVTNSCQNFGGSTILKCWKSNQICRS